MSENEFRWNSSLALGIPHLDEEHKELIDRMRRLSDLNNKSFDKELIILAFQDLIQYTQKHFDDEIEYMKGIKYPQWESHHKIHQTLIETLENYRTDFKGSVYHRFPTSVFDFFKVWITGHILIVDKQFLEFKNSTTTKKK